MVFFFFFKQKTAYEMRISDWSSDVCSSDLDLRALLEHASAVRSSGGYAEGVARHEDPLLAGDDHRERSLHDHAELLDVVLVRLDDRLRRVVVRSEGRRVGKACVRKCSFRGEPYP